MGGRVHAQLFEEAAAEPGGRSSDMEAIEQQRGRKELQDTQGRNKRQKGFGKWKTGRKVRRKGGKKGVIERGEAKEEENPQKSMRSSQSSGWSAKTSLLKRKASE